MEDGVMVRLSRLIGLCDTATLDEVMALLAALRASRRDVEDSVPLPPKMNWCPNGYSSDYEATVRDMGDHVVLETRYLCIRETMFTVLARAYEAFGKRSVMFFNGEKYEWGAATTLTDLREQQSRGLRAARLRG